jgi:Rnl2 family RNA ligase
MAGQMTKALAQFRPYPSLLSDRGAITSAARLRAVIQHHIEGMAGILEETTETTDLTDIPTEPKPEACGAGIGSGCADPIEARCVATPKIHGSNLQLRITRDGDIRVGRRSGFLGGDEKDHYGHTRPAERLGMNAKLARLQAELAEREADLAFVTVYMEVYGGWYPHPAVPSVKMGRKAVQKGIWYSPDIEIVAFDVQIGLETGAARFLDFDDASELCTRIGIPFVPVAFTGGIDDTFRWAVEHAADNALQHYNPNNLPLLEGNGGEGFVVRTVKDVHWGEDRGVTKIKSDDFKEERGPTAAVPKALDDESEKLAAIAKMYAVVPRVASVASKLPEAEVDPKNLRKLSELTFADVMASVEDAEHLELLRSDKGAKILRSACFAAAKDFLRS